MCIIIHKPAKVKLDRKYYESSFKDNPDGAGLAYVEGDNLVISKGFFQFDPFYAEIVKREEQELLIHCRVASPAMHVSKDQCHPFAWDSSGVAHFEYPDPNPPVERVVEVGVGGEPKGGAPIDVDEQDQDEEEVPMRPCYQFAIVHNGRLPWRSTALESDTSCFVSDLLGPHLARDPYFFDSRTGLMMIEPLVMVRNKLVIMRFNTQTHELKTYFVNKKEGVVAHECWFSNTSYIPRIPHKVPAWYNDYEGMFDSEDPHYHRGRPTSTSYVYGDTTQFSKVDDLGWKWSFDKNCWMNERTKEERTYLTHRVQRPAYMARFDRGENNKELMKSICHHLSKDERAEYCRIARDWWVKTKGHGAPMGSIFQAITSIRKEVKGLTLDLFTDAAVDRWILSHKAKNLDAVTQIGFLKAAKVDRESVRSAVTPLAGPKTPIGPPNLGQPFGKPSFSVPRDGDIAGVV